MKSTSTSNMPTTTKKTRPSSTASAAKNSKVKKKSTAKSKETTGAIEKVGSGTDTMLVKEIPFTTLNSTARRKYERELFSPSDEIRKLDLTPLVGKTLQVQLSHDDQGKKTNQYATLNEEQLKRLTGVRLYLTGWLGKYVGKPSSTVKLKVEHAYITGHMNGGRQSRYCTRYGEFFDDSQKELVQKMWAGGVMGRMFGGAHDYDRADIIIQFEGGLEIDCYAWDLIAPGEWYSNFYKDRNDFQFNHGFFTTPQEATDYFLKDARDDLFGTRFFPVCVFPLKVKPQNALSVVSWAKSHSKPILLEDKLVFGTRCKPSEVEEVIQKTYAIGGKVAKYQRWEWD